MRLPINTSMEERLKIEDTVIISKQFPRVTRVQPFCDDNKTPRELALSNLVEEAAICLEHWCCGGKLPNQGIDSARLAAESSPMSHVLLPVWPKKHNVDQLEPKTGYQVRDLLSKLHG